MFAGQYAAGDVRILSRVTALHAGGVSRRAEILLGQQVIGLDAAIFELRHPGGRTHRNLVQAVVAVHDEGPPAAQQLEGVGKHLGELGCINAQQLAVGACRVGQRPQHIENTAQADFLARPGRIAHGTVVKRRIQKADTDGADGLLDNFRRCFQTHPEDFQQIGAAAAA